MTSEDYYENERLDTEAYLDLCEDIYLAFADGFAGRDVMLPYPTAGFTTDITIKEAIALSLGSEEVGDFILSGVGDMNALRFLIAKWYVTQYANSLTYNTWA